MNVRKGFRCGLRYEALDERSPRWLATYEVEDLAVLQTAAYLGLRDSRSPKEVDIMSRISSVNRSTYRDVLCKGRFQPSIGIVLVMVQLLMPSVNAKELEDWYEKVTFYFQKVFCNVNLYLKEHIDMLAEVPGWLRSRLLVETNSTQSDVIHYTALHEYLPTNGLGGPKHIAGMSTNWRERIMSLSIGGPARRDFRLFHIF